MLKLFELLSRRADMTHEQCMAYWTQRHAAIAREAGKDDPKSHRYVNNVGLATGYETWPPFATCPYDGIVGVWMDRSFSAFRRIMTNPENPFIPDEPNFVRVRPYLMPVDEVVHRPAPRDAKAKLMVLFTRPLDSGDDAWARHWREAHVPAELAFWGERLTGLTTGVAQPYDWHEWGTEASAYDGCAEYWFSIEPEAVMAALAAAPQPLIDSRRRCIGPAAQMFVREVFQIDRQAEGSRP